jgi:hypothetical protein
MLYLSKIPSYCSLTILHDYGLLFLLAILPVLEDILLSRKQILLDYPENGHGTTP